MTIAPGAKKSSIVCKHLRRSFLSSPNKSRAASLTMSTMSCYAEERREKALDALRQVGLENYAHSYPDELSGGMRQRVGLARALAINPDILLMDEAFSALDPLIRTEMQDELVKLQAKHQRTIVFISHDLDEAM
eukprot:393796_1